MKKHFNIVFASVTKSTGGTGSLIICVTISAIYNFQNMGRTFKWKSLSNRRYNNVLFDTYNISRFT